MLKRKLYLAVLGVALAHASIAERWSEPVSNPVDSDCVNCDVAVAANSPAPAERTMEQILDKIQNDETQKNAANAPSEKALAAKPAEPGPSAAPAPSAAPVPPHSFSKSKAPAKSPDGFTAANSRGRLPSPVSRSSFSAIVGKPLIGFNRGHQASNSIFAAGNQLRDGLMVHSATPPVSTFERSGPVPVIPMLPPASLLPSPTDWKAPSPTPGQSFTSPFYPSAFPSGFSPGVWL